jgi:hypothetical protein
MNRATRYGAAIAFLLATYPASAQSTAFHDQIERTYNFQPHLLNPQQIAQKSNALDQFWREAKSEPSHYLPTLRLELGNFKNPPFFLYDGSMLLLSLSDNPADRKVALAAVAHCDLRDVQTKEYFAQVHRMATLNDDTTAAAFHVLDQPDFTVIVPQHALTLGQDYILVYLLLPTDQSYWLQPAINRLRGEQDQTAQKSVLLLLWYAQTDAADRAIADFARDEHKPPASRTYAKQLLRRKDDISVKSKIEAPFSSDASIRQRRRERMQAVSDEALIDLDDYTAMLIAKRK